MYMRLVLLCSFCVFSLSCSSARHVTQPGSKTKLQRPLGVAIPRGTFALMRADLGELSKGSSPETSLERAKIFTSKIIRMLAIEPDEPRLISFLQPVQLDNLDVLLAGLDEDGELIVAMSTAGNEGLEPWLHGAPVMDVEKYGSGILYRFMLPAKDPELLVSSLYDINHQRQLVEPTSLIESVFVQGQYAVLDVRSWPAAESMLLNQTSGIVEDVDFFSSRSSPAMKAFLAREHTVLGMYLDVSALPWVGFLSGLKDSIIMFGQTGALELQDKQVRMLYAALGRLLFNDESIMEYEDLAVVAHITPGLEGSTVDIVQSLTPLGQRLYAELPASDDVISRFDLETPLVEFNTRKPPVQDEATLKGPVYFDILAALEPDKLAFDFLGYSANWLPGFVLAYAPNSLDVWFGRKGLPLIPSTSSLVFGTHVMSDGVRVEEVGGYTANGINPELYGAWSMILSSLFSARSSGMFHNFMYGAESEEEHAYIIKMMSPQVIPPMSKVSMPEDTSVRAKLYTANIDDAVNLERFSPETQAVLKMFANVSDVTLQRTHYPSYVLTHMSVGDVPLALDLSSQGSGQVDRPSKYAVAPCAQEAVVQSMRTFWAYIPLTLEERLKVGGAFIKENEARREDCVEGVHTIDLLTAHWSYMHANALVKQSSQDEAAQYYAKACQYGVQDACDVLGQP